MSEQESGQESGQVSEQEKEAIVKLKHYANITAYWKQEEFTNSEIDYYIKLVLNYIERLEKENEEYHRIKKEFIRVNKKIYDVDTIDEFINTIDKLQKENEELEKTIDLMATELSRRPLMIYLDNERDDRLVILDNPKEIIKYYTKKAEE